jgi:hypothetical protein
MVPETSADFLRAVRYVAPLFSPCIEEDCELVARLLYGPKCVTSRLPDFTASHVRVFQKDGLA